MRIHQPSASYQVSTTFHHYIWCSARRGQEQAQKLVVSRMGRHKPMDKHPKVQDKHSCHRGTCCQREVARQLLWASPWGSPYLQYLAMLIETRRTKRLVQAWYGNWKSLRGAARRCPTIQYSRDSTVRVHVHQYPTRISNSTSVPIPCYKVVICIVVYGLFGQTIVAQASIDTRQAHAMKVVTYEDECANSQSHHKDSKNVSHPLYGAINHQMIPFT